MQKSSHAMPVLSAAVKRPFCACKTLFFGRYVMLGLQREINREGRRILLLPRGHEGRLIADWYGFVLYSGVT